jgi:hypothetical protein
MNFPCFECNGELFYYGEVYCDWDFPEQVSIPIRPRKFKLGNGSDFLLPSRAIACIGCGSIWSQFDTKELEAEIKEWLVGNLIKNTYNTTCKVCSSGLALDWKLDGVNCFQYQWTTSYWTLFSITSDPKLNRRCVICRACGYIQYKTPKIRLVKLAKGRKPFRVLHSI